MAQMDLKKLADELETMAVELRQQANTIDARAAAMDREREGFVRDISESLQKLRQQAGLPAKNVRDALERDPAQT